MNVMPQTAIYEALYSRRARLFKSGKNVDIVGVTGSIPVTPTIFSRTYAEFAKWPAGSMNLIRLFFVFRSLPVPS